MKLFMISFLTVFLFAYLSEAHGDKKAPTEKELKALMQYNGTWTLSKGKKNLCPDKLVFSSAKKGEVKMSMERPSSTANYTYKMGTVVTKSDKTKYKAVKKSHPAYTLVSSFNTSIANGRLVSNHLWSGEGETWTSMGTKVIGFKNKNTLVLDKAITGYGNPKEDHEEGLYKKELVKKAVLFNHQQFELGSSVYHCEFSKSKKMAKN